MKTLQIDIETYSSTDLIKCGVYRYAEDPDFEILLFGYAYDDDPVQVIDLTAFEDLPDEVIEDLTNPCVLKTAFNANFERTCITKHFSIECDPAQWQCTQVWALTLGLPSSLKDVAQALKLEAQKDDRGKALIKYFSVPCKPTKVNGGRTRNYAYHDPEKWQEYIEYNRQDVIVEREIRHKLSRFPVPAHEWKLWALDQKINDTGMRIDPALVQHAIKCSNQYSARLRQAARALTNIDNPNSLPQLKAWLADQGLDTPDGLGKEFMPGLLEEAPSEEVKQMLELRQEMGKTSVDKYNAMSRSVCQDDRIRGVFQFCGANRTWRWAGRIFQPHNLPQNKVEDLALARKTLRSGDYDWLETLYGAPPFILSQLIRTAIIPAEGCQFIVADFSAIEARIIAWLADEDWVLNVFRGHGKIYEATAAQMFKVPIETIIKGHVNYALRAKGKVAVLACGYQGGPPALIAMGALKSGIPEDDLPGIIRQYRQANPNIVRLWYAAEKAAIEAVQCKTTVKLTHGVRYRYESGVLFADLPGGRSLAYVNPRIKPDPKFNKDGLVFDGMDQVKKKWMAQRTYGGRLVENLVQAIARDCLAESMTRLDQEGYSIVMHVHDEVILEMPTDAGSVEHACAVMGRPIPWAPGLPLTAAGFECEFYQKD
ncbi:MAG TPA: DNA polymerase [Syntrophomonas sp.]|nr:DNA polymerase [Syntrophomonas sp.]